MSVHILAIESSCDDTAAAVLSDGEVHSNVVASQTMHELYGGVVPEVASRAHNELILPTVQAALEKADVPIQQLSAIACTQGPGLMGSLMVGFTFAKSLAMARHIPLIGVHHMKAHILAHFLEAPYPTFPFLCLTVSGGHTQLVVVRDYLDMEIIGQTRDDAAGEAFDKAGKMMGLPYPAGPVIDRLAKEGTPVFSFPEPQVPDLDFSFSGLKTAIMYFIRDHSKKDPDFLKTQLPDLCASVQETIVRILISKIALAVEQTGIKQVAVAGGVSANRGLRHHLQEVAAGWGCQVFIPKISFCTDNAAMIAGAAQYKYAAKLFSDPTAAPDPRLPWDQA